ncbi:GTPase [Sporanaerobacter sp. PP17-6a]|uniref:GTPase n=1 Tax=Sporanaerobacter sp. PP17-6a TaxID=1891289 RepID=UPI00089FD9DB|nr:GTPase [Sporanaerobacter sp. PP17-6a]NLI59699.1 GTP-binding protein [Clostridium sp.]SCL81822.1 tRNA modification GTPase TrmE [Sporanaerobacter sp. PP17-6a]
MEKGNVLLIGNSGVGKSTLINSILGERLADTGVGIEGVTKDVRVYEKEGIPFRLIDTAGLEPSYLKQRKTINEIKKWSAKSAKEGYKNNQVNLIWFCVDGTSKKLFIETIKRLSKSVSIWKTVPIIIVITKSYSQIEKEENIKMVKEAFERQKHFSKNLKGIIPVVADTYQINEEIFVAPEGIDELIDLTNSLMPEGIEAGKADISAFKLNQKKFLAHGLVGISTTSAVVIGAIPIPFPDASLLAPIELATVNTLAKIFEINKMEDSDIFINHILEMGVLSLIGKNAVSYLKGVPGINLGASVINAIVAGSIVMTLGQITIYAFEQVYLGKKTMRDIDWLKKLMESSFSSKFMDILKEITKKVESNKDKDNIANIIIDVFKNHFNGSEN